MTLFPVIMDLRRGGYGRRGVGLGSTTELGALGSACGWHAPSDIDRTIGADTRPPHPR